MIKDNIMIIISSHLGEIENNKIIQNIKDTIG